MILEPTSLLAMRPAMDGVQPAVWGHGFRTKYISNVPKTSLLCSPYNFCTHAARSGAAGAGRLVRFFCLFHDPSFDAYCMPVGQPYVVYIDAQTSSCRLQRGANGNTGKIQGITTRLAAPSKHAHVPYVCVTENEAKSRVRPSFVLSLPILEPAFTKRVCHVACTQRSPPAPSSTASRNACATSVFRSRASTPVIPISLR